MPAPGRVDPGTLAAIPEGLACSLPIEPLAFSPDGARHYARLLETEADEAWLIVWPAASDLELHDHGGSEGVFHLVEGAGDTRRVAPTTVHRVWNAGPEDALSVHVYSPPLTLGTFFDDNTETFLSPLRPELVSGNPEGAGSQ